MRPKETRHLTFGDMRLTRAMQDPGMKHATLDEYARATGMSIKELLQHMKEHVDSGDLAYETVGDKAFVMTRTRPDRPRGLPKNLWEALRERNDPENAYMLWQLGRDLEQAGWKVNYTPEEISGRRPPLNLPLRQGEAPLILFPEPSRLLRQDGPLARYQLAGRQVCAIACRNRQIDRTITAVRSWYLEKGGTGTISTLILEEPSYQPVRIDPKDGSHQPRSSSITSESRNSWAPPA